MHTENYIEELNTYEEWIFKALNSMRIRRVNRHAKES